VGLSNYAIEKMGYTKFSEDDHISVKFAVQRIYTLQGVKLQDNVSPLISKAIVFGKQCKVIIAQSVNEAANIITGEDYAENEDEWAAEKKARPPYVLVCFEEQEAHILRGGYRQEKDDYILTYDAFENGKKEIEKWELDELPSIITALTVHFSMFNLPVKLITLDRNVYGKTANGKTLFDSKMKISGKGYVSRPKSVDEINSSLQRAVDLYSSLNEKTSRNIFMALEERDPLKQFLYYFLFIERFTHSQFKNINFDDCAKHIFNIPTRLDKAGIGFFKERQLDSKNLAQRFQWCSLLVWDNFNDEDVDAFKSLKKTRDLISHGENVDETKLPIHIARNLALKMLGAT